MKKLAFLALATLTLSSCSWTRHEFFGEDETAQNPNGSGYPYYYSSAAAPANPSNPGAIDANEQQNQQQPFYATQTAQPSFAQPTYAQQGGYGVQSSAPSVSINYGNKGTDVSAAKVGEATPNPNPVLPNQVTVSAEQNRAAAVAAQNSLPKLPTTQQYQPQYQAPYAAQQYPAPASYGTPQMQTPPVVSPYQQPAPYGYAQSPQLVQPQPIATPQQPIQPQPVATGQQTNGGLTYEQYQQMYYGQPPYNAAPYQYPPTR